MVRKGQVHARQLSHFIGAGLANDQQEEEQELHVEGELQGSMDHRDGGPRQLSHESQPYHGDESLLRRSYGGFGVNMHSQGIPLGYRPGEEVPQREDMRNVIHRPYEQRDVVNVHQPVEPMRWSREEEPGYDDSNKQLAVAQMMAEMHQGNMLQQRSSNLMMMASQMGQGRYHPEFLQTGGRMLFGAPPPRVSTEERFPYQAEMMRQNQAMMFGMAPPAIEKGRFEELFQQQRGMMMDMAARGIGDSRMQEYYLGRPGMVDPSPREPIHSRNHVDFGHPRVGMVMGMSHDGWRSSAENVDTGEAEDIRHDVPLDGVETNHLKVESHVTEPSREHFIDRPALPHRAEHSPDSTPNMSIIQPNHTFTSEGIVDERVVQTIPEAVPRIQETVGSVSNNLPLPGVGSLGVRDTVAEMVMEMERRDREKMHEMSGSDDSSSSEQSESESEAEEAEGNNKPEHHSIPAQVSPCEVDETSKVLHPARTELKLPHDTFSQESGSESDESSVAPDHDLEKNPSSVSSQEDAESPIPSPTFPLPPPIRSMKEKLMAAVREGLNAKEEDVRTHSKDQQNSDLSSDEKHDSEEEGDESGDETDPKQTEENQQKSPEAQPHSPDSEASSQADSQHDIKSVRMPMWRWIGPKQSRSTRVTRQSAKKGNLTIRLVKRKQPPKKRGRRRKTAAVPITKESFPTAVPCAHPTSKRRGKVFQKVVMEDMVVMDGQIMTVNKRGRPRKVRREGEVPKKRGRQKRVQSEDKGPPKKRGRPRKEHVDKEPVKKVKRVRSKSTLPRNVKLISIPAPENIVSEKDSPDKKTSHLGPAGKDFGCPFCGKEFKCGFRLNKHMQTHIPKEVLEQKDQGTIQMQLALSPDREKRMVRFDQCQFCKQLFMDLKAHIRRVHSEAEEHLCSICGHVLRNKESLVAHEKRHKVVAAGKKEFVCKECGADFFFQTGLNQHSKRHLSERACVCEICGKAFKTTKDLEKHKLVHTKPHSCPVCKRRFGQKSNMKAHMRQHSGDKPFRCDLCSASFTHNVSLKTHKKNTHGIDWWKEHGKKEESDEKMEKMAIMNACMDYFGNTGNVNGAKWEPPAPPPNPAPPAPNPNPINPLLPLNPINPLNSVNHFTPINHNQVSESNNDHTPMHLPHFTPLNSLSAMHPDARPHPLEDIKPII